MALLTNQHVIQLCKYNFQLNTFWVNKTLRAAVLCSLITKILAFACTWVLDCLSFRLRVFQHKFKFHTNLRTFHFINLLHISCFVGAETIGYIFNRAPPTDETWCCTLTQELFVTVLISWRLHMCSCLWKGVSGGRHVASQPTVIKVFPEICQVGLQLPIDMIGWSHKKCSKGNFDVILEFIWIWHLMCFFSLCCATNLLCLTPMAVLVTKDGLICPTMTGNQ